jgi:hypothetical protein
MAEATVKFRVDGQLHEFDIVKVTVREPQSGALFDMKMAPEAKMPLVYGYTDEQIKAAVESTWNLWHSQRYAMNADEGATFARYVADYLLTNESESPHQPVAPTNQAEGRA